MFAARRHLRTSDYWIPRLFRPLDFTHRDPQEYEILNIYTVFSNTFNIDSIGKLSQHNWLERVINYLQPIQPILVILTQNCA